MKRGIPPRTMSDVTRGGRAARTRAGHARSVGPAEEGLALVTPFRKPREWQYQTKPVFRRLLRPLVDVFDEADEILIVVDLGGFARGEISIQMTPRQYVLRAARGAQRFEQVIDLPEHTDVEHAEERFRNGVLEIVLPRTKDVAAGTDRPSARRARHEGSR